MLITEKKAPYISLLLLFVGVGLLKCLVTGAAMLSSGQSQREQLAVRLKGRVLRSGGRLTGRAAVLLLPKNWKLVHWGEVGGGQQERAALFTFLPRNCHTCRKPPHRHTGADGEIKLCAQQRQTCWKKSHTDLFQAGWPNKTVTKEKLCSFQF